MSEDLEFLHQQRSKFDKRCKKLTTLLLIALSGMCQLFYRMGQLKNGTETQMLIRQIVNDVVEPNTEIAHFIGHFDTYFTLHVGFGLRVVQETRRVEDRVREAVLRDGSRVRILRAR